MILSFKKERDKKKKRKKAAYKGKAYVVEWGGAKKSSPKNAMHLVVVL